MDPKDQGALTPPYFALFWACYILIILWNKIIHRCIFSEKNEDFHLRSPDPRGWKLMTRPNTGRLQAWITTSTVFFRFIRIFWYIVTPHRDQKPRGGPIDDTIINYLSRE